MTNFTSLSKENLIRASVSAPNKAARQAAGIALAHARYSPHRVNELWLTYQRTWES